MKSKDAKWTPEDMFHAIVYLYAINYLSAHPQYIKLNTSDYLDAVAKFTDQFCEKYLLELLDQKQ